MIMELILTCICKNPPLSSDPFPPSLSSHSHSISPPTHPITPLSSFSLIFTPDSPHPSIIRPNSLTLAPLSSLLNLSCPTINPHPITSAHSLFHPSLLSPFLTLSFLNLLSNSQLCSTFLILLTEDSHITLTSKSAY